MSGQPPAGEPPIGQPPAGSPSSPEELLSALQAGLPHAGVSQSSASTASGDAHGQSESRWPVPSLLAPLTPSKPRRKRVVLAGGPPVTVFRTITEVEEQTSVGAALVRDLMKAQLKLALGLFAIVVLALGSLPVAALVFPRFAGTFVVGVPLPWLLLGVLPFPLLFAVGFWYHRLAERNERDFIDMIEN